eukprot:4783734-Pleurochrysis_carterae.AAC.1
MPLQVETHAQSKCSDPPATPLPVDTPLAFVSHQQTRSSATCGDRSQSLVLSQAQAEGATPCGGDCKGGGCNGSQTLSPACGRPSCPQGQSRLIGWTERRGPSSPGRLPHSLRKERTRLAWVPVRAGRPSFIITQAHLA